MCHKVTKKFNIIQIIVYYIYKQHITNVQTENLSVYD